MLIEAIFCDLDDTIMPEDEANITAYELAGELVEEKYEVDSNLLGKLAHHYARALWLKDESYFYGRTIGCGSTDAITAAYSVSHHDINAMQLNNLSTMLCKQTWLSALNDVGVQDEKLVDAITQLFPEIRRRSYQPYNNVVKILQRLSSDYPLAIVTNGVEKIQLEKTKKCGVDRFADVIVVSERIGVGKPHFLMFEKVIEKLGVPREKIVMVGDSLRSDIEGAQKAGIGQTVWVRNQYIKNIEGIKPNFVINSLIELPNLLKTINS